MKCRDLVRSPRNASVILSATLILASPTVGLVPRALASVSTVNISNMTDLLSRLKVATANIRKFETLAKSRDIAVKSKAINELKIALKTQRKSIEDFRIAMNRELAKSPASGKLFSTFAIAFNARITAQASLARANLNLNKDQEIIKYLQKALKAVVAGGQSDMNSELGSMRLKLSHTLDRISGDQADVTLASSELALAITNLSEATSSAHADPLASIAIDASTDIHANS